MRRWAWLLLLVVALALLGIASSRFYWHQQLYYYIVGHWSKNPAPGHNIWLPDYHVVIDGKPLEGIEHDLSGVTYDYDHDRLLVVTNGSPMEIVVLSKTGERFDRYTLEGFQDVEGIAYMGNDLVALTDENYQQLDFVKLPATGQTIQVKDAQFIALGVNLSKHNKGFEGITYDAARDRLFIIKERDPRQLYEVSGVMKSFGGFLQINIQDLTSWIDQSVFARDLSDAAYDPQSGHLLILSDQSKLLVEVDSKGQYVSFRSLTGSLTDLKKDAPQPEGVAMDRSGNLYVVSEPNLFYTFQKKQTQVQGAGQ